MKRTRGFTLIECILALSLFAVVLSVGMGLYLTGYRMYRHIEGQVEAEDNVRIVLDRIAETLRRTDNLPDKVSVSNHSLKIGTYQYYLKENSIHEKISGTANNLAQNILSYEPSYENGLLTIRMKGSAYPGGPPFEVERVFYIGGE